MSLLPAILGGTQTPHQPLLVVQDSPAAPAAPLLAELVQRARDDGLPVVMVCALHAPEHYGLSTAAHSDNVQVLDLTDIVPGYTGPSSSSHFQPETLGDIAQWILKAVDQTGRRTQVFVDALDIVAADYGTSSGAVKLVKEVLRALTAQKAPARLTLLLPYSSSLLPHLTASALSTTLTALILHPPALISSVSTAYLLAPPPPGLPSGEWDAGHARWWGLLRQAGPREGWRMALEGEGVEVGQGGPLAVEVLVRKAQGGASKGMSRALEGLVPSERGNRVSRLDPVRWDELPGLSALSTRMTAAPEETSSEAQLHPSQSHIPFNLSLTPAQAASRADVPVPYAHEGDEGTEATWANPHGASGPGRILFEPGSEDDMDEDDPDEDLDF